MTALSLFTGVGGLDLAAMACGIEVAAMCEKDPFCRAVLEKRFPRAPIARDVREVEGDEFGAVDIVFGGFPCQDLSLAGANREGGRKGLGGERSGLWFEMLRIVRRAGPAWVLAENVRGATSLALDTVRTGLEDAGYAVRALVIPASALGAPHQRERLFVVGMRRDLYGRLEGLPDWREKAAQERKGMPSLPAPPRADRWRDTDPAGSLGAGWISQAMGFPYWWTDLDKEILYATTEKTDTGETLLNLWKEDGTKELQRKAGRLYGLFEEEILLSDLLQDKQIKGAADSIRNRQAFNSSAWLMLRRMRHDRKFANAPSRQQYLQQFNGQLDDFVQVLSHEVALAAWKDYAKKTVGLEILWASVADAAGIVPLSLSALRETWAHISECEKMLAACLAHGWAGFPAPISDERLFATPIASDCTGSRCKLHRSVREDIWQIRHGEISPKQYPWELPRLERGDTKKRKQRVKALGNAVVPQQAYPLFKAIVEIEEALA